MNPTLGLSHWHKLYRANIGAPLELIFELASDLPNYCRWLPPSEQYGDTIDVEPYPVRLGTRYHDGKPLSDGKHWVPSRPLPNRQRLISTTPYGCRRPSQL